MPQQFFGQTFSSSSFVGPNGQVVSSNIYTDSEGNRIVNGVPINSSPNQNTVRQPQPAAVARPVSSAIRPQPSSEDKSGAYKPDKNGW